MPQPNHDHKTPPDPGDPRRQASLAQARPDGQATTAGTVPKTQRTPASQSTDTARSTQMARSSAAPLRMSGGAVPRRSAA